jgi:hypothetical protein
MMAADYAEERLYVLEGRILALQAVIGVFLNEITPTDDARRRARDVISRIMDRVDLSALPGYSESAQSHLAEGFFGCLNDVSSKIVVTE